MKLIETRDDFTGPINIGNPVEFSMLELARTIIEITDSKSPVEFQPLPQDDPKQRRPNIDKAREFLYWEPKVQLLEGLQKTIQSFLS